MSTEPPAKLGDQIALWRRRVIAGAIVLLLGGLALYYALSAMRVALETQLGVAGGRFMLAALLATVAMAVGALMWVQEKTATGTDAKSEKPSAVAAIIEAMSLGFGLAQDLKSAMRSSKKSKAASADEDKAEAVAEAAAETKSAAAAEREAVEAERKAAEAELKAAQAALKAAEAARKATEAPL